MKLTGARSAMFGLLLGAVWIPVQTLAQTDSQAVAEEEGEESLEQETPNPEKVLADMILNLEHFPSDSEKETLMAMAANPEHSEALRTIATALHVMEHTPSPAHEEALREIVADDTASNEERLLAEVLASFNHTASEGDAAKLADIE